MRIAYILTSLGIGGAEKQVIALAERMAARGHIVTLLVLREPQANEWITAVPVHHLQMRKSPLSLFRAMLCAHALMRRFKPDIVHSHTFPANMVARVLRLVRAAPWTLSTIHNVYEGGALRMTLYRLTDPLARHTTAVSQAAMERFVARKAVPPRKCSTVTNGIDLAEFTPSRERRESMRARLAVQDAFVWLAIGRITEAKDYPNMLRAFWQLTQNGAPAHLCIAGESAHPANLEVLQRWVNDVGMGDRVHWLGMRRDIAALLDAADGFVLSSAWEGMPLVLGEAMAMGKTVVATDVGGVREITGQCGLVVAAHAPTALAAAMQEAMALSESARHELGQRARDRIAAHFSIDARADEWERLYDALCTAHRLAAVSNTA